MPKPLSQEAIHEINRRRQSAKDHAITEANGGKLTEAQQVKQEGRY